MKKIIPLLICVFALFIFKYDQNSKEVISENRFIKTTLSGPEEIARFHHDIRTPVDREFPEYFLKY